MAAYQESIPDLIRGTIRDGIGIVRDEILLARTEMRQEVVRIKSGLITVAAAVGIGVLAVVMLLDTIAGARLMRSTGPLGRASPLSRFR